METNYFFLLQQDNVIVYNITLGIEAVKRARLPNGAAEFLNNDASILNIYFLIAAVATSF